MANVSYLRSAASERRSRWRQRRLNAPSRQWGRGQKLLGAAGLVLVVIVGAGIVLVTSSASLTPGSAAIADVGMPLGGGKVESAAVVTANGSRPVPIELRGQEIYPQGVLPADEALKLEVVVKRPGWISWLAGSTQRLELTMTTPVASLRQHYLTLASGAPLQLQFKQPVAVIAYGSASGALKREVLASPQSEVTLPRSGEAGSILVAAAPRAWETSNPGVVAWFPPGAGASAVASPAPGTKLLPSTPITLTFSQPVASVLGSQMPPMSHDTSGAWHTVNDHTIVFEPQGYGYGLGNTVTVGLPSSVTLVGGQGNGSGPSATWTVPAGSTLRLQQLLATLGYLPLRFKSGVHVANTPQAQEAAAIHAPAGTFDWRWSKIPPNLRGMWAPGVGGTMTKGAVMAFQNDHGMNTDGVASGAVWNALITAVLTGHRSTFGYTFVTVSEGSPETESTWHNGRVAVSGLVNTGISGAATAQGTFPVFMHALSVTMSGYNPDGSYYSDPGIPYTSYFNGGDALHGFIRGSYGYPQSLGCVEMPYSEAGQVYPYTPIGTLVNVVS